jgi:tripartite-type tricarboxylate transporter receptor subunit TctC
MPSAGIAPSSPSQGKHMTNLKLPHRRQFLLLAAGAAATPFAPQIARAQAYPTRPVRIVVPFAPGGNTDIYGRLIGQWLSERLGQPFVIENRPGANTNIGTEAVVRAPADGYTLLMFSPSAATNATMYQKLSFNFIRDIAPVAGLVLSFPLMLVNPKVPAKTVPEFLAFAKANPGKVSFASQGIGSPGHVAGELFKMMTGVDMVHVPYRGGAPALTDLIGGQVQVMFISAGASIQYLKSGQLRALAISSANRSEAMPDVPTVGESVSGYEVSSWFGIGTPRNTPADLIDKLNKEINAGLADQKIKALLADADATPFIATPAEFGKFIANETEKWGKVIRAANIKPE